MRYPRLNKAGHGSGCVLSAYITANMAMGNDLVNSALMSRKLMQEAIASQYEIGEGEPVVNPTVKAGNDKVKTSVLEAVDDAARKLMDLIPIELVLKGGINIAYAMPNAAGPEEIAAVDRRLVVHNGMLVKNGPAKLGSAEHLSYVLLEIMKENPDYRCIMNILDTPDTEDIIEEVGLRSTKFNRKGKPSLAEMTKKAIAELHGKIPDAIIDREEKMIRIVGKDPNDVLDKLESIL